MGLCGKIYKSARLTMKTATAIDHVFTNAVLNSKLKTEIFKTNISDHFPIISATNFWMDVDTKEELHYLVKRIIYENSIELFKNKLQNVWWSDIKTFNDVGNAYANFLEIICLLYDKCFTNRDVNLKPKE